MPRSSTPRRAHWTAREVLQQPQVWAEIYSLIEREAARLAGFLDPLIARRDVRVVLTGAGLRLISEGVSLRSSPGRWDGMSMPSRRLTSWQVRRATCPGTRSCCSSHSGALATVPRVLRLSRLPTPVHDNALI